MRKTSRVHRSVVAIVAALGVAGALLVGATPASGSGSPGIVVSGLTLPADADGSYSFAQFMTTFRATPQMVESEIIVVRQGAQMTVLELEGGPSMAVDTTPVDGVTCRGNNPAGLSDEVVCTFRGATTSSSFGTFAVFSEAPMGVTFAVEQNSRIAAVVLGSSFDDYIQGGPLNDALVGGDGDDFLFGGGGNDTIAGGEGDDVIYGDDDPEDNPQATCGDDLITGGPGDDYIEAGCGKDDVWGGPGADEINMKDGEADGIIQCEDSSSTKDRGTILYDMRLDRPYDCNVNQAPVPSNPVFISPERLVDPGTVVTAKAPQWLGTAPMTYAYRWESCVLSASTFQPTNCQNRGTGELTSAMVDARTKKAPTYTVTASDRGRAIRFVAIADNSKLRGGARAEAVSTFTNVVKPVDSITIRAASFPQQKGKKWSFAKASAVAQAIRSSNVGPWVTISERGWRKAAAPKNLRKDIKDGDLYEIYVNGKRHTGEVVVEAASDQRATIELRYFSSFEDRKTCPATDDDLNYINSLSRTSAVDLAWVTEWLDAKKCPWVIADTGQVGSAPRFTVSQASIQETEDEDRPVEVRLAVRRPSTSEQLAIAVGAPPNAIVAQSPEHFSLGAAGSAYAFPGSVFTSVWVNLIGDQARMPSKRARMEFFLNGRLRAKQELFGDFSSIPATVLNEVGTARIILTTLNDNGSTRAQVFVDFPVVDPARAPLGDLVTWDGRCFNRDGTRAATCANHTGNAAVSAMRQVLATSKAAQLMTLPPADALRFASEKLNKRFTPIVVNGPVMSGVGPSGTRMSPSLIQTSSCVWWDVACVLGSAIQQVVNAVIRPKPAPRVPKPTPVRYRAVATTVPIPQGGDVAAVTTGKIAEVPGAGLIGLDGASLIGLDGASLIGLDGASLIGLDGASLIGLDGASLIGLDGASLIGLDGASFKPGQVSLPLISDQGGS
jgi:hypothetical protein